MTIRINRVYTRSGDRGETGLVGGSRISKASERVAAIGDLDELNAALGTVKEQLSPQCLELRELLEFLQQELFDLGSEVAVETGSAYPGMWRAGEIHVKRLEGLCDFFGDELEELTSFILPGGSQTAATIHLARSIARRAERTLVALAAENQDAVSNEVLCYVNRLSDMLFNMARWCLKKEGREVPLWQQEDSRSLPDRFAAAKK